MSMVKSFRQEFLRSLPLFRVVMESIEVHGDLITFADFVLTYLGVLGQDVVLTLGRWALESESLLEHIREPFHIIS